MISNFVVVHRSTLFKNTPASWPRGSSSPSAQQNRGNAAKKSQAPAGVTPQVVEDEHPFPELFSLNRLFPQDYWLQRPKIFHDEVEVSSETNRGPTSPTGRASLKDFYRQRLKVRFWREIQNCVRSKTTTNICFSVWDEKFSPSPSQ